VILSPGVIGTRPVPATQRVTLSFVMESDAQVDVEIYDSFGRLARSLKELSCSKGSNELSLDLAEFAPGVYYVKIPGQPQIDTGRFIKIQ
jgi:hypothetical protein